MSAANRKQLRQLLDSSPSTAEFLEDVQAAIEGLYAESDDDGCADGFKALDAAVEAFEAHEEEDDEGDDDEEDEAG